jgi:L-alanine-DL-glutamate epimerase-like enolase superfamily enzyme
MSLPTDIRPIAAALYFLPVQTRVPLKFGGETLTSVICARVRLTVRDAQGRRADGWGETPLSVQWVWPSAVAYQSRLEALQTLCHQLNRAWSDFDVAGHPMEVGHAFLEHRLPELLAAQNASRTDLEPMPWLAALVCCSAFDLALHDGFGQLHGVPTYETYTQAWMNRDLSQYFDDTSFAGKFPADFLTARQDRLPAWHLVGGLDPITANDLHGDEPDDGYPLLLGDWIRRDGLNCLKVKLRGNDSRWDYQRMLSVGDVALTQNVRHLSADFNCTVTDADYVADVLDCLSKERPEIYDRLLYVEQPFPYDLERHRIDVHALALRRPMFLDESAHDWRMIELGRTLGWNGVALKTCKTQSGAILSLCWARAHGMQLMVQDLTNPMLAMIPHALLAAYAGTIQGVETNACQFYPDASKPESRVHPRLYRRRDGMIDGSTVRGAGFGYRVDQIERELPSAAATAGDVTSS